MNTLLLILQDAFFAAIAGIGFASISNPPKSAFKYCAIIAAAGHATRYVMMNLVGANIIPASLVAALLIGMLAVYFSKKAKCPPETFSFPSLLPMIPGIYAYRALQALIMCMTTADESQFHHYAYLFGFNGLTTIFVVLAMVVGQLIPIHVFPRRSYSATRVAAK